MAPTKRQRSTFSPPRPRKTTGVASTSKSSIHKGPKSVSTKSGSSKTAVTNSKSKAGDGSKRRSRLVSPTPSASDSLGEESEDNAAEEDNEEVEDETTNLTNEDNEDSPEPDYILAEVSHESTSSLEPPIPLGLIHRILHSHFAAPDKTKISTDAREVVGKYIEIFVREAIMRCAYERKGNGEAGARADANAEMEGGGWLEVEDLEKVAVQLCLDF